MKTTVFLAYGEADERFAREAAAFLESGCEVICDVQRRGADLPEQAEEGLSSDVLVLVFSEAACGAGWKRERWEPVLRNQERVMSVALEECRYPGLLRRRNFFDAGAGWVAAMRGMKRWLWRRGREADAAERGFSAEWEEFYRVLADRPGVLRAPAERAEAFAREAGGDFEALLWVAAKGRSLACVAGGLGVALELRLEGTAQENWKAVLKALAARRCLLIADDEIQVEGRTSVLVTDAVPAGDVVSESMEGARSLLTFGRNAEAYELLYRLMDQGVGVEACARELAWICDAWDRAEEAETLRARYHLRRGEQMRLW